MRKVFISCIVLSFVASCGSDSNPDSDSADAGGGECSVAAAVASTLGDADATECGRFAVGEMPDAKELSAAEACVISAQEMGKPFEFIYERSGIDSNISDAYAWAGGSADIAWFHYDSFNNEIVLQKCSALELKDDCDTNEYALCLSCVTKGNSSLYCTAS